MLCIVSALTQMSHWLQARVLLKALVEKLQLSVYKCHNHSMGAVQCSTRCKGCSGILSEGNKAREAGKLVVIIDVGSSVSAVLQI